MTPMYALALIATVSNVYPHVLRDFLHRYISSQVFFEVSFVSLPKPLGGFLISGLLMRIKLAFWFCV